MEIRFDRFGHLFDIEQLRVSSHMEWTDPVLPRFRGVSLCYVFPHLNKPLRAATSSLGVGRRGDCGTSEGGSEVTDDTRARFCHSEFIDGGGGGAGKKERKDERRGERKAE